MSYTPLTKYTRYLNNLLVASGRNAMWLDRLNDASSFVSDAAQAGTVVVPVVTAFTAQTITDGTLQTNQFNNTTASLTGYDRTVPISLKPSQLRAVEWSNPENITIIAEQAADGLRKVLAAQVIADLVAASPGFSKTLSTGNVDFASATQTDIAMLDFLVASVIANSNADPSELTILTTPTGMANLFAARNALVGFTGLGLSNEGYLNYAGIPIFPVAATTTNWGTSGKAAAFVVHKSAYTLAKLMAYPHDPDRFWVPEGDGTYKHLINGTWFGGVSLAGVLGKIVNPTA